MGLSDTQADREPAAKAPAEEDGRAPDLDEPADVPKPALRTVMAWAIEELAAAKMALLAPPPDHVEIWEAFAASQLEWETSAGVPVDLHYVSYARWEAARGVPVLADAQVLAWLTDKGACVRTGAVSRLTAVEGVRVVT